MNLVLRLVRDIFEFLVYRLTRSHSIIGKFVYAFTLQGRHFFIQSNNFSSILCDSLFMTLNFLAWIISESVQFFIEEVMSFRRTTFERVCHHCTEL